MSPVLKNKFLLALLPVAVVLVAWGLVAAFQRAQDPRQQHAALAERLLGAMERGDYAAFVGLGDKSLRRLRREDFDALAGQNAARLKGGHGLAYAGESERGGVRVSKWTVTFRNGSADAQLTLGVRDGEVALFALR